MNEEKGGRAVNIWGKYFPPLLLIPLLIRLKRWRAQYESSRGWSCVHKHNIPTIESNDLESFFLNYGNVIIALQTLQYRNNNKDNNHKRIRIPDS